MVKLTLTRNNNRPTHSRIVEANKKHSNIELLYISAPSPPQQTTLAIALYGCPWLRASPSCWEVLISVT